MKIYPAFIAIVCALITGPVQATQGVGDDVIRIGGVLDLEGRSRGLGRGMARGIRAALDGAKVKGKRLDYLPMNDSDTPEMTVRATRALLERGVFAIVGNVGTPTAKAALPILADSGVPAVGFLTGADVLRPGVGYVINFRASYVQETAAVITSALDAGMRPQEICAYVQNDAYGMAGVEGVRRALARSPGMDDVVASLDTIVAVQGDNPARNNIGPVGVYTRNTLISRTGYQSLKRWEADTGNICRLVIGVGTYNAIARFAGYARLRGEKWIVSAVSFTGADNLREAVAEYEVKDGIVVTQVVPPADADLDIVRDARVALGDDFGHVSLEGYIVGRMLLAILDNVEGDLTREKFVDAVYGRSYSIGGLRLDFTDDNQGSDEVFLTYLDGNEYKPLTVDVWRQWIN